jgi:hypothetical protein
LARGAKVSTEQLKLGFAICLNCIKNEGGVDPGRCSTCDQDLGGSLRHLPQLENERSTPTGLRVKRVKQIA